MSLKAILASMKGGSIIIPVLQDFVSRQNRLLKRGLKRRKGGVITDAKLTIKAMQDRIKEFNHGEEIVGEFFHPSRLGGCLRQTWFGEMGAKEEKKSKADDLKTFLTFEIGTYFHVLVMNLMERAKLVTKREVAIMDRKLKILGHCDVAIQVEGVNYIVEIKTINSRGFAQYSKQPRHDHKVQLMAYMASLKAEWGIILYFNKDSAELREFVIQFDDKFDQAYCRKRIDLFFEKVKSKMPPEREEGPNCAYCPWADLCFDKDKLRSFLNKIRL